MYKVHKNGKFRNRASFEISPDLICHVNAICERDKLTFAAVCEKAIFHYVTHFGVKGLVSLPLLVPPDDDLPMPPLAA